MFTDMVGYTALTQSNESLALEVIDRHNRLLRPFFPRFHGREVKAIGDSFLVEFESALDALSCAVEIQSYLHDYNISSRDEWKINIRIGIHLGDVTQRAGDVFGDAVNIAARIEPIAEPEGICLSEQVYDQVRNKSAQTLVKLGRRDLKNVEFPIDVYRVVMPWDKATLPSGSDAYPTSKIAILPFASMSPDPTDEYFADGMTEELITTMSKIGGLKVMARTSIMTYKGAHKKINEIAKELEVGTVLEGSVRKAGNTMRITVQLIDSQTGDHVWAESYDRELKDVFAVQSDISKTVAQALKVQLLPSEKALIEGSQEVKPEAFDKYLLARQQIRAGEVLEAIRYLEKSVRLDPEFALAYSELAQMYVTAAGDHLRAIEAFANAKRYLARAVELDDRQPEVWLAKGNIAFQCDWDWEASEKSYKRAIELNPSNADAYRLYSYVPAILGRHNQALELAAKAVEFDPLSLLARCVLCFRYALAKRRDEALLECVRLRELHSDNINTRNYLALVYAELGLIQEAKKEFDTLRKDIKAKRAAGERGWFLYANWAYADNAFIYSATGDLQAIGDMINEAEEVAANSGYVSPAVMGTLYLAQGNREKGFDFLEKSVAERDPVGLFLWVWRFFEPFRSDPRFVALLKRIGI
jgi:adenylate cyclase